MEDLTDSPTIASRTAFFHPNYDIAPDGKTFVFLRSPASAAQLILVHDWKYELRARMDAAGR